MGNVYSQQKYNCGIAKFIKIHQLSIGFLLVFFGVAELWFVMPKTYAGLEKGWHVGLWFFFNYMPEWVFMIPILLVMSLIGTLILTFYCSRDIQSERIDHKQEAAILVTALGFTYQVIGAWPLWSQPYPWPWQTEIAKYGNLLVFSLFLGSVLALIVGAVSLYIQSKKFHEKLKLK